LSPSKVEHLKNPSPNYQLLIIALATPLQIGVYCEGELIAQRTSEQKTSEVLLPLLMELLEEYPVAEIIYTRGPGSYMAIKLTYIILKTIEITRGIVCRGCSAFALNGNQPIKAIGNLYFIKEKETIMTKKFEQPVQVSFILPQTLQHLPLDEASTPEYRLPAV